MNEWKFPRVILKSNQLPFLFEMSKAIDDIFEVDIFLSSVNFHKKKTFWVQLLGGKFDFVLAFNMMEFFELKFSFKEA